MNKKGIKFFTYILLIIIIFVNLIGCSNIITRDLEANIVSSLVDYGKYKDKNIMTIMAWTGPKSYNDNSCWQLLKDSGINTLILNERASYNGAGFGTSLQENYIKKCEEYGINCIGFTVGNRWSDVTYYPQYHSIAGINYDDEPNITEMLEIAMRIPDFETKYPNDIFFVCLLSAYSGSTYWGVSTYKDYINSYYDTVLNQISDGNPKYLAVDCYPIMRQGKEGGYYIHSAYLYTLGVMSGIKLKDSDVITHMAMQSASWGPLNDYRYQRFPTEADYRFQVNTCLAFGVESFSNFTFNTPEDNYEFMEETTTAILDREGNTTSLYNVVKTVNSELLQFDEIYMSFDWQGIKFLQTDADRDIEAFKMFEIYDFDDIFYDFDDTNVIKSISSNHNALVGYFIDENKNEAFYVSNYGDSSENISAIIDINFIDCNKVVVYKNGGIGQVVDINNNYSITLDSGEGAFILPYKA